MSTEQLRARTRTYRYDFEERQVSIEQGAAARLPKSDRFSPDAMKAMRDEAGIADSESLRAAREPNPTPPEGPDGFDRQEDLGPDADDNDEPLPE